MTDLANGAHVTFKGGTGRNDADKIIAGIVNGELVQTTDGMVYVPVHVPTTNQNVMIAESNIVRDA
jgi:hypothetical protein